MLSIDFGSVNIGQQIERIITLRNPSSSSEGISGSIGVNSMDNGFSIVSNSGGSFGIPIGQSLNVRVRFAPTRAGQINANLVVMSSTSATPIMIPIIGTGVAPMPVITGATMTLRNFNPQGAQNVWQLDRTAPRDSGFIHGTNIGFDRAKATAFILPQGQRQAYLKNVGVWFAFKRTGLTNQTYRIDIYNGSARTGPQGQPIASREYRLAGVNALNTSDLTITLPVSATIHNFDNVVVGESFFASVDFGTYVLSDAANAAIVAGDRLGRRVAEDWERATNGAWYNMSDAWFTTVADGWNMWIDATVQMIPTSVRLNNESNKEFQLAHTPNPCTDAASIQYTLQTPADVRLEVYSALGVRLMTLIEERQTAGNYVVPVDVRHLPSGQYYYRLRVGAEHIVRSLQVIR